MNYTDKLIRILFFLAVCLFSNTLEFSSTLYYLTCKTIKDMRLFIAIDIEDEIKEKIEGVEKEIEKTGADIKFVEKENLHFTLKFLNEVREDDVNEAVNKISDSLKGMKQFKMSIEGVGFFGNQNYIRTIWIGVGKGGKEMEIIIDQLNQNLNYIRKEEHESSPHLTIGRVRTGVNREQLVQKLQGLKGVKFGETIVKEVKLKQSQLTKQGPMYSDLKVFELEQ